MEAGDWTRSPAYYEHEVLLLSAQLGEGHHASRMIPISP